MVPHPSGNRPMWEELRYRWALRKYLNGYTLTREAHASVKDFSRAEGEPDIKHAMEKEQTIQEHEIGVLRSKYLVRQAYLNDIQVPDDEASWLYSRYMGEKFLTPDAAATLRDKIRLVQKQEWDYWAARVTMALAIIGVMLGVLAYFKK
jgi:hypothetical protein